MANIPQKTIKYPDLPDTYTFLQLDDTLSTAGKAADAKKTGDELTQLKSASKLLDEYIPDTVQTINYDASGNVASIVHTANNAAVRTDVFTFAADSTTEVRTLSTGESLTIVTNTETLATTITYAAA